MAGCIIAERKREAQNVQPNLVFLRHLWIGDHFSYGRLHHVTLSNIAHELRNVNAGFHFSHKVIQLNSLPFSAYLWLLFLCEKLEYNERKPLWEKKICGRFGTFFPNARRAKLSYGSIGSRSITTFISARFLCAIFAKKKENRAPIEFFCVNTLTNVGDGEEQTSSNERTQVFKKCDTF